MNNQVMPGNQDFAPIFIIGHPRSGSTLLTSILGEHSMIAALPETHFVRSSLYGGNPIQRWLANSSLEEKIKFIYLNVRLQDTGVTEGQYLIYCRNKQVDHRDSAALLQAFLELCRENSGKKLIVEKTPAHIVFAKEIMEWFPNAKMICIVRDARDAVESLMKVSWTHSNPARHAVYWAWCVRRAGYLKKEFGERVEIVRYEDLLSKPEDTLSKLCGFLNLSFEAKMLSDNRAETIVPAWESGWKTESRSALNPASVFRWKKKSESAFVSEICGYVHKELEMMDYDVVDGFVLNKSIRSRIRKLMAEVYLYAVLLRNRFFINTTNRQHFSVPEKQS